MNSFDKNSLPQPNWSSLICLAVKGQAMESKVHCVAEQKLVVAVAVRQKVVLEEAKYKAETETARWWVTIKTEGKGGG